MIKPALIVLFLAAAVGTGAFVYSKWKNVPHSDEELVPSAAPHEKAESKTPEKDEPVEHAELVPPSEHKEPVAAKPKKAKAVAGHFEMSTPASVHDELDASDNPGFGKAREKRLAAIFKLDKDLARSVSVKSIHCRVDTCIIEAESKDGDADRFQSLMFAITKQYPWLGNKVDVTTPPENPHVARYVYFQETPK